MKPRNSWSHLIAAAAVGIFSATAFAADPVQIVSGGPASQRFLTTIKADLEKAAGVPVELKVSPTTAAISALQKNLIDGVTTGAFEEMASAVEKGGGGKLNKADFQIVQISESFIKIGVHPDNPVKSLSKDQVADILSGKVKNWKEVGGQDLAIKAFTAKNYQTTMILLNKHYIGKDEAPAVTSVLDRDGLLKAIKAEKGAIGFFTGAESMPDFKPAYMNSHVARPSFLYMKAKPRKQAQAVFDLLKSRPPAQLD